MKLVLVLLATLTAGAAAFAALESPVSRASVLAVERSIDDKFRANPSDPYDFLGTARGTYMNGYGALFTFEIGLTYVPAISPFNLSVSPQQVAAIHERKLKKLPVLENTMRGLVADASTTLEGLPANEHIAIEALLFSYSWENSRGLPHRVFMTVEKQKLRSAIASHADLATVIETQER